MRLKRNIRFKLRIVRKRYMALTQNDTIDPDKALAVLKDSNAVDTAKRLARRLMRRGVETRFAEK